MVHKVNVTVDDVSPLIIYSPREAWYDGDARDQRWDSLAYNGTFMVTDRGGSTASLTFNGTAVWLYGSKGKSNGGYKVTLDGDPANPTFVGSGFSDQDLFQQVLFEAEGLDGNKTHLLTVENVGTNETMYLVVDSIVHEVEVPDNYQEFKEQDMASSFEYSPSAWSIPLGNISSYDGQTGQVIHFRQAVSQALVIEAGLGSDVEIYGMIGPSGGTYTVLVDDGSSVTFNAESKYLTPRTLLYRGTGLGLGPHKVRMVNTPFSGQTLSIDYAIVRRPPSTDGDPTPVPGPSPSSLSRGMIGGIAAGVIVTISLILSGAFIWYCRLRKRGNSSGSNRGAEISNGGHSHMHVNVECGTGPVTPHTPSLPPLPSPPVSPIAPVSLTETNAGASLGRGVTPFDADARAKLVSHTNADRRSEAGPSELGHGEREVEEVPPLYPHATKFGAGSFRWSSGQISRRPLPKPQITSSDGHQYRMSLPSGNDFRNTRMWVEGRVQDFGPAPSCIDVSDPNPALDNPGDLLPPDYNQATEPFPESVSAPTPVYPP